MYNVTEEQTPRPHGAFSESISMKLQRFAVYSWAVVAYNLAVVLWGAFVRATGSGAGCGSHWPLCNGVVIPRAPAIETIIEFSHRLTSGVALLLVVGLVVWAMRRHATKYPVVIAAWYSFFFMIVEALVGAGLVLFGLTDDNASVARAVVIAIHLINTFLLLAALTLTAWFASGGAPIRIRRQGSVGVLLGIGVVGTLLVGAAGAITALGDTLFPVATLREGLARDIDAAAHFLERLRVIHPILAVSVGMYLIAIAGLIRSQRPSQQTRLLAFTLISLIAIQLLIGALNVVLLAPVWMQLVHLLLADLLWMSLILFGASVLAIPQAEYTRRALPRYIPRLRRKVSA